MKRKNRRIAIATSAVAIVVLGLAVYLGWPHLVFWYQFAPLGLNAKGYLEYRHRQTGIIFVRLPGGKCHDLRAEPELPGYFIQSE
jgi:hypothetical protein